MICGMYSTEDEEIKHDGTILAKVGLTSEDIESNISFDVRIELVSGTTYTGTVTLKLPVGDIIQAGTSTYEKNSFDDVIFKRN